MKLRTVVERLRRERRPVRFLLSRILWKTRLCRLFQIRRNSYKLHFSPSAVAALLWVEPEAGRAEEALLGRFLNAGDLFVDAGANVGYLALAGAVLVGESGRVVAVEPHPRICQMLRANVALNKFWQVEVVQAALGNVVGQVTFSSSRSDDQNQIIEGCGLAVPLTRLDVVLREPDRDIALIKIDVEGYEKYVLEGMGVLLRRTKVVIFESFEANYARHGYTLSAIIALLSHEGFVVGKIDDQGRFHSLPLGYLSVVCENLVALNRALLTTDAD